MIDQYFVAGVPVSLLNMELACKEVERRLSRRQGDYFIFRDMNGIVGANRDPALLQAHVDAGFVAPDGMPLVWLARWLGFEHVGRVYGPDFMLEFCRRSERAGYRHFFYGSTNAVIQRLIPELKLRFPRLHVCGHYAPPFRAIGSEPCVDDLQRLHASHPDIVWVGLGTPKQELWMRAHSPHLRHSVLMGVGAAFDFHAKVKRQAPLWMQRSGLEWSFRLMTEPRRLVGRYAIGIPRFLLLLGTRGCHKSDYRGMVHS